MHYANIKTAEKGKMYTNMTDGAAEKILTKFPLVTAIAIAYNHLNRLF